ncbi:MAG: MFS transporter [Caldilineaceae bacterium]
MPPGHRAGPLGSAPGHAAVDAGHGGGQLGSPQPRPRRAGVGARLIGAGMAGVLMGSLKMFSQWFPVCRFATVSGLLVGIGSFGASCGHTLGLAQRVTIGWRNVFLVGAVVTAPFAAYIMLWTRNTPPGVEWTGNHVQQGSLRDVAGDARIWRIIPSPFSWRARLGELSRTVGGTVSVRHLRSERHRRRNVLLALGVGTTLGFGGSGWACDRFGLARTMVAVSAVFIASQFALAVRPPLAVVTSALCFIFGLMGGFIN